MASDGPLIASLIRCASWKRASALLIALDEPWLPLSSGGPRGSGRLRYWLPWMSLDCPSHQVGLVETVEARRGAGAGATGQVRAHPSRALPLADEPLMSLWWASDCVPHQVRAHPSRALPLADEPLMSLWWASDEPLIASLIRYARTLRERYLSLMSLW